jgi:4-hydroxy-tetrahydrodipicolinate synthase
VVVGLDLRGVHVALFTPLLADGGIDAAGFGRLVEHLVGVGVDGLAVLGTTGEFCDLTPAERQEAVAATVDAAQGRVPVIVGIGALGTREACGYAKTAHEAGADAVLSLPPLFWRLDEEALFRHFAAVAEASDLPMVLYDIPMFAGTSLSPALVVRVADELDTVVGIKMSVQELVAVQRVLSAVKPGHPDFRVVVGFEDIALPALLAGADGVVSGMANFYAPTLLELVAAVAKGDMETAVACHRRVTALSAVYAEANPSILALKEAAQKLGTPIEPRVRTQPTRPGR